MIMWHEVTTMADITIQIPDELSLALGKTPEERTELLIRALALECFQLKWWSKSMCGRLMGTSRMQFDEILMHRRIPDHVTGLDVAEKNAKDQD